MSIAVDLERVQEHAKWIRYDPTTNVTGNRPIPVPKFKDCRNCDLRHAASSVARRRMYCNPCQYEEAAKPEPLPVSPSPRFHALKILAMMPESVTADLIAAGRIDIPTAMELNAVRRVVNPVI